MGGQGWKQGDWWRPVVVIQVRNEDSSYWLVAAQVVRTDWILNIWLTLEQPSFELHGSTNTQIFSINIVPVFSFFFKFIYLFIYFWLSWVFVAARRLSLVAASRGYSSLQRTVHWSRWLLLLQRMGSRLAGFSSWGSWALERRLSSCGTWA